MSRDKEGLGRTKVMDEAHVGLTRLEIQGMPTVRLSALAVSCKT